MAERDHHSIGEVLALVQQDFPDVTISKIRFLESQGLLDPQRTTSGYRKFYDGDVERLRWILHQQRDHYLPLKVIKDRIQNGFADPEGGSADGEDSPPSTDSGPAEPEDRGDAPDQSDRERSDDGRRPASGSEAPVPEPPVSTRGAVDPAPSVSSPVDPLDDGMSTVSMTADELAAASGLTAETIDELSAFGLIESRTIGAAELYEGEALTVARLAAAFLERGIEARHLKMYRLAAEREAGFYEQVVSPLAGHRDPATRSRARTEVRELVRLGAELKTALLRRSLRDQLGGP
jgi:DNA-binding transcriptional MerR regulator